MMKEKPNCNNMKIEELSSLRVRVYNALRRAGISTVGQLISTLREGRSTINGVRHLGEAGLHDILRNLEIHSCLPDNLPLNVDVRTQSKRMKWVVNSQHENGSWFDDIEMTIAAVLSLIRSREYQQGVAIEAGIEWLRQREDGIDDSILLYAFQRNMAEYYSKIIPESPFDLKFTEKQFYSEHDAGNLDELRRMAILKGNAVKIAPYYDSHRPEYKLGLTYTPVEIMWMSVDKPHDR